MSLQKRNIIVPTGQARTRTRTRSVKATRTSAALSSVQNISLALREGCEKVGAIIALIFRRRALKLSQFYASVHQSVRVPRRARRRNYLCQEVMIVSLSEGYACNYLFVVTIPWQKQSVRAAAGCCSTAGILPTCCVNLLARLRGITFPGRQTRQFLTAFAVPLVFFV